MNVKKTILAIGLLTSGGALWASVTSPLPALPGLGLRASQALIVPAVRPALPPVSPVGIEARVTAERFAQSQA